MTNPAPYPPNNREINTANALTTTATTILRPCRQISLSALLSRSVEAAGWDTETKERAIATPYQMTL